MAGLGNPQPCYTLYVRNRDGMMRLVNTVGVRVPIAHWHLIKGSVIDGICVTPVGAIGVTIFEDEFVRVEEFPRVEVAGGSGKTTAKLVAIAKEPSLVA